MKKFYALFCAGLIVCSGQLSAQEPYQVEIMDVQVDGDQDAVVEGEVLAAPMIFETTEDLGDGSSRAMRVVTSPNASMSFMSDSGLVFGGGGYDSFSMLNNPSVRKELELVDDQMDRIREVNQEFSKRIRDSLGDLSKDGFDPSRTAQLKDTIADIQKQKQEEIDKLLLPHQQERLKQVALQMQMKSRGTANALSSDQIAEALGLTQEQIDNLKTRSKELSKEIEEKTKQLRADAKQELIGMLSKDQQKKLKEMTGDKFESKTDDWREALQRRVQRRVKRNEQD